MRVACLVLSVFGMGCGLTLDLTPPEEDGGAIDGVAIDGGAVDGGPADAVVDAERSDTPVRECANDLDCFRPDCILRSCEGGECVENGGIVCAPIDECHVPTGACLRDGTCEQALIDEDGDGHASMWLGACGTDCDDEEVSVFAGGVCAIDLDNDGYGSDEEFDVHCGDVACEDGYVANRDDCWDADREGVMGGDPDPIIANPNAMDFYPWPRTDDGTFDWNCDGEITTNNGTDVFAACTGTDEPPGACRRQSGWASEAPECGDAAGWINCSPSPRDGTCEASIMVMRFQYCR